MNLSCRTSNGKLYVQKETRTEPSGGGLYTDRATDTMFILHNSHTLTGSKQNQGEGAGAVLGLTSQPNEFVCASKFVPQMQHFCCTWKFFEVRMDPKWGFPP